MKKFLILNFIMCLVLILSSCTINQTNNLSKAEVKEILDKMLFFRSGTFYPNQETIEQRWGKGIERKVEENVDPSIYYVVYDYESSGKLYLFYADNEFNFSLDAAFSMKRLSKRDFENIEVGKTTKADIEKIDPATEFTYCEYARIWDNNEDKCSRHFTEDGIMYILYKENENGDLIVKDFKFMYEDIIDKMLKEDLI